MTCPDSVASDSREYKIPHYSLDKLDDAFLFVISTVGLLFTIIQVYRANLTGIFEIIPLLILGVFLPFYVGYIRGAIYDSLIERVRGWIYLIVGVSAYSAFLTLTLAGLSALSIAVFLVLASLLFSFVALLSIQYIEKWFRNTFSFEESAQNMYAFSGTVASSFLLAFAFVTLTKLLNSLQFSFLLTQMIIVYPFILVAVVTEKLSRQVQNAHLTKSFEEIENEAYANQPPKSLKFLLSIALLATNLGTCGVRETFKKSKLFLVSLFASLILLFLGSFLISYNSQFPEIPEIIPDAFLLLGMVLLALAVIPFFRLKKINFESLDFLKFHK
jgi:hypothetical protein